MSAMRRRGSTLKGVWTLVQGSTGWAIVSAALNGMIMVRYSARMPESGEAETPQWLGRGERLLPSRAIDTLAHQHEVQAGPDTMLLGERRPGSHAARLMPAFPDQPVWSCVAWDTALTQSHTQHGLRM